MKSEIAVVSILFLLVGPALAEMAGLAAVIDGDMIDIQGQSIRLHGIDATKKGLPVRIVVDTPAVMKLDNFEGRRQLADE